jgi:hypothetical protein
MDSENKEVPQDQLTPKIEHDYQIGGYWGNNLKWITNGPEWKEMSKDGFLAKAYGAMEVDQQPEVGNTVLSEFKKSWVVFEVVNKTKGNSREFWVDCKPVERVAK